MPLTRDERDEIHDWVVDTRPYMLDDIDKFYDWVGDDFDKFERYQSIMDDLNEAWANGEDFSDLYDDLEDLDLPDDEWTFYHG